MVNKKNIFICQINETTIKLVRCVIGKTFSKEFNHVEIESIPPDASDSQIAAKLAVMLKKAGYSNGPVTISLPRNKATCRYIKIPAQSQKEIENILSLQVSRYLPYASADLINGYQVINTDKDGYSNINLVIVHKDVVDRYIRVFTELKNSSLSIILSSYGLASLFNHIDGRSQKPTMLIDIDANQAELAIVTAGKLCFSRYFRLFGPKTDWVNTFNEEIKRSCDAYAKDFPDKPLKDIIFSCQDEQNSSLIQSLAPFSGIQATSINYFKKINLAAQVTSKISQSGISLASLIGLAYGSCEDSLNLLPASIKEKLKSAAQQKQRFYAVIAICAIGIMLISATIKIVDNKSEHLNRLNKEISKIENDAKFLVEIEKRMELVQRQAHKKPSNLDVLSEMYKIIPENISLTALSFDDTNTMIIRGQTPDFNNIFAFISAIEKSAVFKKFSTKVRYATKKATSSGETTDFEILAVKEK